MMFVLVFDVVGGTPHNMGIYSGAGIVPAAISL